MLAKPLLEIIAGATAAISVHAVAVAQTLRTPSVPHYQVRVNRVPGDLGIIRTADVDREGLDDIVGWDGAWLTVLRAHAGGRFELASRQLLARPGAFYRDLAVADFDRDGIDDVAVVLGRPGSTSPLGQLFCLRGNGAGEFSITLKMALAGSLAQVAAADFDGDGWIDLVTRAEATSLPGGPLLTVLDRFHGLGDGRFVPSAPLFVESYVTSIAAADFDNDRDIDLACARQIERDIVVMRNDGAGEFVPELISLGEFEPQILSVGNVTAEPSIDLIAQGEGSFELHVAVVPGSPTGLTALPVVTQTASVWQLLLVDLNRDSIDDLIYKSGDCSDEGFQIAMSAGDGSFTLASQCFNAPTGTSIALRQDGDSGATDILVATNEHALAVFSIDRDGSIEGPDQIASPNPIGSSRSLLRDIDLDGNEDLLVLGNPGALGLELWLRDPRGTFLSPVSVAFPSWNMPKTAIATGDLNHDGLIDLAVGTQNPVMGFMMRLGQSEGGFLPAQAYFSGGRVDQIRIVDVNADGIEDVVLRARLTNRVNVLISDGSGALPLFASMTTPGRPDSIDLGDIDGDRHVDLVIGVGRTNMSAQPRILLMHGLGFGAFVPSAILSVDAASDGVVKDLDLADFDQDGDLDVVCAVSSDGPSGHAAIYRNDGRGHFDPPIVFSMEVNAQRSDVLDVNGDGAPDLIVWGSGAVDVYLRQPGSEFLPPSSWFVSDVFQFLDMNDDGVLDLLDVPGDGIHIGIATPAPAD